jgi:hypothetical protein
MSCRAACSSQGELYAARRGPQGTWTMTDRVWIEMPAIGTGAADDPVRPKYPVRGRAFLMHKEGKVYVTFGDEGSQEDLLREAECGRLTPAEGDAFEESLPFPIPRQLFYQHRPNRSRPVGLGDIVSWLARRAGFIECGACQQRKRWLNRIFAWGWR